MKHETWVVTDDRAGVRNQSLGLARALGLPVTEKLIAPIWPWTWLPVRHWIAPFKSLEGGEQLFAPPYPRIAIGCGWRTIPFLLEIKRRSHAQTTIIQLQHPRVPLQTFDFVVPPEHDHLSGSNVLPMIGSPNLVTPQLLALAEREWSPQFSHLPKPRLAVLIGGTSKSHRLDVGDAGILAARLQDLLAQNYSLLITTSRRTGEKQSQVLRSTLSHPNVFFWDGLTPNPYHGLLACADVIIVTSDSTNMAVEAAGTGKPVYVYELQGGAQKFDKLHARLRALGITRRFEGQIEHWHYTPLRETERVAAIIRTKLGLQHNDPSPPA